MGEKWVMIYTFFDILEGKELESLLKGNNIPTNLISRQDSAFDGLFKHSIGEGIIQVREDYVIKAKTIVDDFKKNREQITKTTGEESKAYKAKIYKRVWQKSKRLYSIIPIIMLVGLVIFIIKNIFIPEGISNYKELINRSKKAIRINSNDVTAYETLGYIYCQLGQCNKAIYYYKKVATIRPDYYSYANLGSAYLTAGNFKEAVSILQKSKELNPKYELSYINLGKAYREMGKYDLAINTFQEVLSINPTNVDAYYGLSSVYYHLKDFSKMLNYSLKTIELDPKSYDGYYNAGLANFRLKSYQEAINHFERAIANNPNYALAYFYLGMIYREQGDKDSMHRQYNKLLELNRKDLANELKGVEYPSRHPLYF